eukprot:scaffold4335_cov119-Cylindrotheca_fusiformis.AAC.6
MAVIESNSLPLRRTPSSPTFSNSLPLRRTPSSPSFSKHAQLGAVTRNFWVRVLALLACAFVWNYGSGLQMVDNMDAGVTTPKWVPLPTHPQEAYTNRKEMHHTEMAELRGPQGPKYNVLVTGAAGFVGMFTAIELKRIGMNPIGYDNINSYYSTELKQLRIEEMERNGIKFVKGDVCDKEKLMQTIQEHDITRIIHLAAQAGVRYSLDHPDEYTRNNVDCFVKLLETVVKAGLTKDAFIYASSSSVYGNNVKIPFRESDRLDDPASLYAATKRSDELIAQSYFNLHNISSIGFRFFTVYGPFGRPDMAPWIFTDKISNKETIRVFNHGQSKRDFTYVDDIVQGVVNSLFVNSGQPELINLGNGRPILLADFVRLVESNVGSKAIIDSVGMQKGDVPVTYADISKARRMLAYNPSTPLEDGIVKFVTWFREYNASQYRMNSR